MEQLKTADKICGDGVDNGFDAIVVGSGYGGSVAACRMSMAGIKVCLLEKGRKWESQDFATDSKKITSAVRMENRNLGLSFGPKDALFQVFEQNDSLATVACGLGGGSLVNAGVMLPTPVRVRRNPNWPKEWESDWYFCEAAAAAMLKVQRAPTKFPSAKVLEEIFDEEIEGSFESSVNLSINFDLEESLSNSMKVQQRGNCLACGNCIAGCPYNAKSSTDKNYLLTAVQAGCEVHTASQVQYVVKNCIDQEGRTSRKRWSVYLNETDFLTCDFVIISAGVFGTTEILFRSQMRGLKVSEAIGCGFSCNGNAVAYLAGSPAPLNAYGLGKEQLRKKAFHERPGPSISSSYTTSLGFTIQSAVLPSAYPNLLFKGITTYGWPNGYWFFHGILDRLKQILSFKASQAIVLNAMGYDESDGKIMLQRDTDKMSFFPPLDPLLPQKINVFQRITKKLGGILFISNYRSASVHHLGGCNVASDPSRGVCNASGQVFDPTKNPASVHPGLYVCDASLIPCSVGVNPSFTITIVSEHVSKHLVSDILKYKSQQGIELSAINDDKHSVYKTNINRFQRPIVMVKETMRGYVGGMPCTVFLSMKMNSEGQKDIYESKESLGECHPLLRGKVGGHVEFRAIEKNNLYIIDGEVNLCDTDSRTPFTQYMNYHLLLAASSGSRYILKGKKTLNPYLFGLYAWRETTTLHVKVEKVAENSSMNDMAILEGELSISILEVLKSFLSLKGEKTGQFISLLLKTLVRTYILQIPRIILKNSTPLGCLKNPYEYGSRYEIATDGIIISCVKFSCAQYSSRVQGEKQLYPVLLVNGYSIESYCLPTEPTDLARTLLGEGHDIWLLQSRLHPLNPSNDFTIEDIGRFDIPAAINKILEIDGSCRKVHIVAHCVGGLVSHISLMGGHVSNACVASLSCTNSSMFFKLTVSSMVKMWLPLIPISMAILGKNKILPLLGTSSISTRHQVLKLISRLLPRYERCTCNECEVFSGIFGNAFWHENVSPSLHHWLYKESATLLPMAAFPHLRKICNAGFIVDNRGNNNYLIHPERMALPTLYISGGRSLLVSPRTSFLANKYMKLHQPTFRHERVVVDGFGHSDLLIGEKSCKEVFPHILSHIKLAEKEGAATGDAKKRYSRKALSWSEDPHDGYGGFATWFSPWVITWLFFCLLLFLLISFNQ
ncbi:uncharacterized protein LOC111005575 isoform X2 [Momordica charantia]|uniref:Cholesterol oxidase n=1 Tax=Momordica charantia TaxID=3673 RepID=A0A6J1BU62_MOMCH|nr:uncharacterized protein LOC111005575 isoform X2 [Momordica charantia]